MLGGLLHNNIVLPTNLTVVPWGFEGFGFPIKVTYSPGELIPCTIIKNYSMGISCLSAAL